MIENKFKVEEDSQDNYEIPIASQVSNQIIKSRIINNSGKKVHNFTPITNKKP